MRVDTKAGVLSLDGICGRLREIGPESACTGQHFCHGGVQEEREHGRPVHGVDKTGTDKLFPGLPEYVNGGGKAPDRVATPSSCAMTSCEHPRMPAGGDQTVGDVEGASGD